MYHHCCMRVTNPSPTIPHPPSNKSMEANNNTDIIYMNINSFQSLHLHITFCVKKCMHVSECVKQSLKFKFCSCRNKIFCMCEKFSARRCHLHVQLKFVQGYFHTFPICVWDSEVRSHELQALLLCFKLCETSAWKYSCTNLNDLIV